jgi:hypothetical protein
MPTRLTICLLSAYFLLHAGAGYAWFFANGKVSDCHVSREIRFGDLTIQASSEISLTENDAPKSVFLAKDAREGNIVCRGGERAWSTALYTTGRLKTCWLASDTVIDGIPCVRASFAADVFGGGAETDFDESGRLKACKLARDTTVEGRLMRRGEHFRLSDYSQR